MSDRYLFKAKKKNWQELPKDEQWVQGYLFDDGFKNGRVFVGGFVIEKYNGTACATSVSDGRDRRLDCLHDLDVDYYPGILSVGK